VWTERRKEAVEHPPEAEGHPEYSGSLAHEVSDKKQRAGDEGKNEWSLWQGCQSWLKGCRVGNSKLFLTNYIINQHKTNINILK
jgi:hypothetical protein